MGFIFVMYFNGFVNFFLVGVKIGVLGGGMKLMYGLFMINM